MKVKFLLMGVLLGLAPCAKGAVEIEPAFFDFNEFGTNTLGVHMPSPYGGLRWASSDWHYMSIAAVPTNTFLALSGAVATLAGEGARDFYFDGARFWSRGGEPQGRFYFYMMRDGVLVYWSRPGAGGCVALSPSR